MKKYIVALLLLLATSSDAAVLWSSNWDTGTPDACWPCKSLETCSFDSWSQPDYIDGDFWQLSGGTISTLSSTQAHSGTYSYYQYRKSGEASTCDIVRTISGSPTTIFVRFYLYLGQGWNNTTFLNDEDALIHFLFTNSAAGSTAFRLNFRTHASWTDSGGCGDYSPGLCVLPEGDGGQEWWSTRATCSSPDSGNWKKGTNLLTLMGAWHCFEYKMQISGSDMILTEWIDGVQTRGPCTGPGQNTSSFNKIIISGWDNRSNSVNMDFYIDDIVIADAYIGPLSTSKRTLFRR